MEYLEVDRDKTFFASQFISDYYEGKLSDFHTYSPDISSLKSAIAAKSTFAQDKRDNLVTVLKKQYSVAKLEPGESIAQNIEALSDSNTYTVTTGQQIHIGLGPLYVLYKIMDVLAIAAELKKESTEHHFVPVFWMASEDHDLEEISEVKVYGKSIKWETNQKGPVGRMNTDGLKEVFEQIEKDFNLSEEQLSFVELCKREYVTSTNLSISFRRILHTYFKDTGLVILDADDEVLKKSFLPVFRDEIAYKNAEALNQTTDKLVKAGYNQQLVIRDCNVFDMSLGDRIKITNPISESMNAYNLSPNAALRPLYQEWILPNLVYVGGQSELKYWMQLKGMFDNYKVPLPILHLRKSNTLIPKKRVKSLSDNMILDLFNSKENLGKKNSEEFNILTELLINKYESITNALSDYNVLVKAAFSGFSLDGKVSKVEPKILEMKTLVDDRLSVKLEQYSGLNKLLRIKDMYFNEEAIQERESHFIAHIDEVPTLVLTSVSQFGFRKSQKIDIIMT
jgi:uncharacterized protein YllA (UPF0747 family)